MIVGNGDVPQHCAPTIDAADLVIRFNDCRSFGPAGEKTDVIAVCNTGRPALSMLGGGVWKSRVPVRAAAEIWCTRAVDKFEAMRPLLAESHPDLQDFCDDYTDGFRSFADATGRSVRAMTADSHDKADAELSLLQPAPYVVPSSGLLVIIEVLARIARPDDAIVLAGFGHVGWEWHPFAAERQLVDKWVCDGLLMRIG